MPVAAPRGARAWGGTGRGPPATPMYARRTRPSRMSSEMTRWVASLIGTARPRPTPATAVLMPITRPRESASAPPELPGLSAASVWMTLSMMRPPRRGRAGSEGPSAETTPAVAHPPRPRGAVLEGGAPAAGAAADDVRRRQEEAVGREGDGAPGAGGHLPAADAPHD